MSKIQLFWFQTFILIVLPVLLMTLSPAFMAARAFVMGLGGLYLFYVLRVHAVTWADLGLRPANFLISLKKLVVPSLFIVTVVPLIISFAPSSSVAALIGTDPQEISSIALRIFLYCIWSVPFQELLFRSYIIWKLKDIGYARSKIFAISLSIFTVVHIPFASALMIFVALYLGVFYTHNYLKYQNIYSIILSHAFVGSVLILIRNYYLPY